MVCDLCGSRLFSRTAVVAEGSFTARDCLCLLLLLQQPQRCTPTTELEKSFYPVNKNLHDGEQKSVQKLHARQHETLNPVHLVRIFGSEYFEKILGG